MSALTASTPHPLCPFFEICCWKFAPFYTWRGTPPLRRSLLPAPTTFCARIQMTWGRFLAEECASTKFSFKDFHSEISFAESEKYTWQYPETWKIREIFTQKYVLKVSTKQDVGFISKIAFSFFHMKWSKLSNKDSWKHFKIKMTVMLQKCQHQNNLLQICQRNAQIWRRSSIQLDAGGDAPVWEENCTKEAIPRFQSPGTVSETISVAAERGVERGRMLNSFRVRIQKIV